MSEAAGVDALSGESGGSGGGGWGSGHVEGRAVLH